MINAVIFDIGRVLTGYSWEKYLRSLVPEEKAYRAVENAVFLNPAWAEHDKGLMTEEEEILDFVSAAPEFEAEIMERAKGLYPIMHNGKVVLGFRRFFFMAVK